MLAIAGIIIPPNSGWIDLYSVRYKTIEVKVHKVINALLPQQDIAKNYQELA